MTERAALLDNERRRLHTGVMGDVAKMAERMAGECGGHRIRQATRLLTRAYDDAVRPLGIQVSQLFVLVAVAASGEEGAPMGKLARTLVMDQTTMSRSVVPLEKAGLVHVVRSSHDARTRMVLLTRAGERMIAAAYPRWEAAQKRIRRTLGVAHFKQLHAELTRLVDLAPEIEALGTAEA